MASRQKFLKIPVNLVDSDLGTRIRMQYGFSGFGVFIGILLELASGKKYEFPKDVKLVSFRLICDEQLALKVVNIAIEEGYLERSNG